MSSDNAASSAPRKFSPMLSYFWGNKDLDDILNKTDSIFQYHANHRSQQSYSKLSEQ